MKTRGASRPPQRPSANRDTHSSSSSSSEDSEEASEDSFEEHASVLPTPPRSTSTRTPPSSSSRQGGLAGLPENIRIQLVISIESFGGIDRVQTAKLFEENSECFGVVGTERYKQVKNKVTRWKSTQRHEYDGLLEKYKSNFATPDRAASSSSKKRRKASSLQRQQPPASPSSPPVLLRAFSPQASRIMGDNIALDSLEAQPYGGTFACLVGACRAWCFWLTDG